MKVAINISDSRERDSQVLMESPNVLKTIRRVDARKESVSSYRGIKSTVETDLNSLTKECSLEDLSQRLIDGDPELDVELFGKQVYDTSRIYLNSNNEPAFGVRARELVYDVNDELKEERDPVLTESNINPDKPLQWSGRLLPKQAFSRKFAFTNAFQLTHINGSTYDFLYDMAKELEENDAFLFLGGGDKGNQPLVLQRNGTAYRGFLEGRTDGKKYLLILHLTNLELKPVVIEEDETEE